MPRGPLVGPIILSLSSFVSPLHPALRSITMEHLHSPHDNTGRQPPPHTSHQRTPQNSLSQPPPILSAPSQFQSSNHECRYTSFHNSTTTNQTMSALSNHPNTQPLVSPFPSMELDHHSQVSIPIDNYSQSSEPVEEWSPSPSPRNQHANLQSIPPSTPVMTPASNLSSQVTEARDKSRKTTWTGPMEVMALDLYVRAVEDGKRSDSGFKAEVHRFVA